MAQASPNADKAAYDEKKASIMAALAAKAPTPPPDAPVGQPIVEEVD